jgi:uncharacterized protein YegP (UPF0339 family)
MTHPRYEVVRTSAGWHKRFVAANGRKVDSSEVYTRRRGAENAIELVHGAFITWVEGKASIARAHDALEVRYVDDRP